MDDVDFNEFFYYDETSPTFLRWKCDRRAGKDHNMIHVFANDPAGNANASDPYFTLRLNYQKYPVHIVIWRMFGNTKPDGYRIDHFDQNKRNNNITNLRCIPFALNSRNCQMSVSNTSGVTGVTRRNHPRYPSWRATWMDLNLNKCEKAFAILSHGEEGAFKLACEYRNKMIDELNSLGQGYTPHHGKARQIEIDSSQFLDA